VVFGRLAPTMVVTDMDRSLRFYRDVLGMVPVFENGNPVSFAIVERDEAELVDDAAALYQHLVSEGVAIVSPPRDADYGMRTFVFADPDGNRMDVGQYL